MTHVDRVPMIATTSGRMVMGRYLGRAFLPFLSSNMPIVDDILGIFGMTQICPDTPSGTYGITYGAPKM